MIKIYRKYTAHQNKSQITYVGNQVCTEIQRLNENKNNHSLIFKIEAQ